MAFRSVSIVASDTSIITAEGHHRESGSNQPPATTRGVHQRISHPGTLSRSQAQSVNTPIPWVSAELISVWLDNADLTATDLSRASLVGSHLIGANLSRANLSQADLRGANLNDAILEDTVLTDAKADTSTVWPINFNAQRRRELGVIEVGDNNPTKYGNRHSGF